METRDNNRACTDNSKTLIWIIALFGSITITQFVAAVIASSAALLVDCMSMLVDTGTYVGNLFAEMYGGGVASEIVASGVSLAFLLSVTSWGLITAIMDLVSPDDEHADDLNSWIVLAFGLWGLAFDTISFCVFYRWGAQALVPRQQGQSRDVDDDASSKSQHFHDDVNLVRFQDSSAIVVQDESIGDFEQTRSNGSYDVEYIRSDKPTEQKPSMNMLSAFMHVGADFLRSITTTLEACFVIWGNAKGRNADAVATLILSATILLGSCGACASWVRQTFAAFSQPRKDTLKHMEAVKRTESEAHLADPNCIGSSNIDEHSAHCEQERKPLSPKPRLDI